MTTPTFVDISDSNESSSSSLRRSCFRSTCSSGCSSNRGERRRVRLDADEPAVHLPPSQLVETLQDAEERRSIWYSGNDIRRMKQACVPVISKLDANQPVPRAVEVDWLQGNTSTRGLEFGTREGRQRKRASLQFQRLVLQEQLRSRQHQEGQEEKDASMALAAAARTASQAATLRAQELAIQDSAFVCEYVENVSAEDYLPSTTTRPRRSPAVVAWVRRWFRAARQARRTVVQTSRKKTLEEDEDGRPRCDTESTLTIMVYSS